MRTPFKDIHGHRIKVGHIVSQRLEDSQEPDGYFIWFAKIEFFKGCLVAKQIGFDYSKTKFPDCFTFAYELDGKCEIVRKNKFKK